MKLLLLQADIGLPERIRNALRDGAIYTAFEKLAGSFTTDIEPSQRDLERAEAGYTHLGGRQPWL